MNEPRTADFVVVGAGIVGLAVARELKRRHPADHVVVLEKEDALGEHASGRNSGVLHSGIYYPEGSLKGAMCAEGARERAVRRTRPDQDRARRVDAVPAGERERQTR